MTTPSTKLDSSWLAAIGDEFNKPYMQQLRAFLQAEKEKGKVIYPPGSLWFNALNTTPFDKVKVVILGQDPYHGPHQAHGLCFSVQKGIPFPPSLQNIFKEIHNDLGLPIPSHGCLQYWAEQGVLLLNAVLTVEQSKAAAHQGKGWEQFTDAIVSALNNQREGLVFLLWGSYAQKKGSFIDTRKHFVLQSAHPSPLSAHRGFLGNKHFSKTNAWLKSQQQTEIDWKLPD
jgi:uracil-DNA glycosylase